MNSIVKNHPKSARVSNVPEWQTIALIILAAILVLAFFPFVYTGTFARYQADDYCSAQLLRTQGFWRAQVASYTGWSNRFSTMLVTGLVDPLDVFGMQILPGLLIAGLLLSSYLLARRVNSYFDIKLPGIGLFCLAGLINFFALYTTPNPFQSIYWRSGSITYTLPVIFLVLLLSFLLKKRTKPVQWWLYIILGLFSFFTAGFSETNAALQIAVLGIGLGGLAFSEKYMPQENRSSGLWIAALVGAAGAIAVILLSPGNAVRMSQMPEPPGFFRWLYLSFRFASGFIYNGLTGVILPRTASFLLGAATAFILIRKDVRVKPLLWSMVAVPIIIFLLAAAVCAPSAYAQSAYPEERALTGAYIILTAGVILEGYLFGNLFKILWSRSSKFTPRFHKILGAAAILLFSLYIVYAGIQVLKDIPDYRARAAAWDSRAAQIELLRAAGNKSVVVAALDSIKGVIELSDDPEMWVNRCAVTYYQVQQITAK